jgi:integrase
MLDETLTRKYRDILTKGQDEIVIAALEELGYAREAKIVDIMIQTGLRSGELQKLEPEQITIENVADESGTEHECGVIRLRIGQTKNNKARAAIFSADLAKYLKALVATKSLPTGQQLLTNFKRACNHAGIKGNLVIHSLRHTRGTRLRKAGVHKDLRKQMLGHMSEEAADIYNHLDLTDQLEAVKKVEEYAGKPRTVVKPRIV